MAHINISTPVEIVAFDELSDADQRLVTLAREATTRSYAPYSRFNVGAAIRLKNGEVICGSNQENAAFTSGTCAERSACFYAHAAHPDQPFEAIAIAAHDEKGEVANPISPCGSCRQSLLEYETLAGKDVKVLLAGRDKIYILPSIKSLLPLAFTEFK